MQSRADRKSRSNLNVEALIYGIAKSAPRKNQVKLTYLF